MIHVFKTSVKSKKDVKVITEGLNRLLVNSWNIDLEDCDKVLRIEGNTDTSVAAIRLLQEHGFICDELV